MPITQDRFIAVLNASDELIEITSQVRDAIVDAYNTNIANANSVLANSQDEVAKRVITDIVAGLSIARNIILEHNIALSELAITIRVEKKYFDRVKKTNDRSAFYQRRARERDKATQEKYTYNGPIHDPNAPSTPPHIQLALSEGKPQAEIDAMIREHEAKQAKPMQQTAEPTNNAPVDLVAKTLAGVSYDPSVLRTSVPSLDELNQLPINNAKDLL